LLIRIWKRILFYLRSNQFDKDLQDEIQLHLELKIADKQSAGMSSDEARAAVLREFGNRTLIQEKSRERWAIRSVETSIQDLRYGFRMLARSPGFTFTAVLSLALGIGANTAIFSLVDAVLLKSLPTQNPKQLVRLAVTGPTLKEPETYFSYPVFMDLKTHAAAFSGVFAHVVQPMGMGADGNNERVLGEYVSGNFFSVLGVEAYRGRLISESDDQINGVPVAVLSYNFWKRRFSGGPDVIGKIISIDGQPYTVIGVVQQGFNGVEVGRVPDVRIPITAYDRLNPGIHISVFRGSFLQVMARMKPEIDIKQAKAATEISFQKAIEPDIRRSKDPDDGNFFKNLRVELIPAQTGTSSFSDKYAQPLKILMSIVSIVLLIACANIANLLLARASARQKEIAVRQALGAGRWRLVRQLLTESLLLSLVGAVGGRLFAKWGIEFLLRFIPQQHIPNALEVNIDGQILVFTLATALGTALLFGLVPAIQATKTDLIPVLKNESKTIWRGSRRWNLNQILLIGQVSLCLLLLIGAGLFVRTLQNLRSVDDGYKTDQVVMLSFDPGQIGYDANQANAFQIQLIQRVSSLPGVKTSTITMNPPLSGMWARFQISVEGYQERPGENMHTLVNWIAPDFFATFGTPFLSGRDFNANEDRDEAKVVIINQTLANSYFKNDLPLGRHITLENMKNLEVVGVVQDAKYRDLKEPNPPTAYVPFSRKSRSQRCFCVRATGDIPSLINAIRTGFHSLDPNLPLYNVKTFSDQIDESISQERLVASLSSFFGLLALLLASIGLYGVMAYSVNRRTREIGIRLAIGGQPGNVQWLILRETLLMVLIGVIIGLPIAIFAARLISNLLFGLQPTDPVTMAVSALILTAVASFAGYLPARKASRIDPMVALRCE